MATLTSTKIKNTYDALLKSIDNDAIGSTAKQITDGLGNTTPLYVSTTQVGIGVTPESGLNLHVYGDAKIGSNLTVIGNLVVEGSTTTVGTDTLTVKDPLIVLANNNTSTDAVDIGFYGKYTPSGTTLYSGLFREALTGKYRLFKGLQIEPTTTVSISGTGYDKADLVIGNIETNGLVEDSSLFTFSKDVIINKAGTTKLTIDNVTQNKSIELECTSLNNVLNAEGDMIFSSGSPIFKYTSSSFEVISVDSTFGGIITVSGTGQSSFGGQVTIPLTPSASTDAASKGYVDANITAQDLDFSGDSGTGSVDLDSQTFALVGTANEIETSAGNQQLQIGLPTNVTIGGAMTVGDDVIVSGNITLVDKTTSEVGSILLGGGNDLQIFHDGSNSFVSDSGTGDLILRSNSTAIIKSDTTKIQAFGSSTDFVTISSSGSTFAGIVTVNGTYLTLGGEGYIRSDDSGYLHFQGGTTGTRFFNNGNNTALFTILNNGNSTFAGDVNISSPGDLYINSGTSYNNTGSIFLSNQRSEISSVIVDGTAQGDTAINFKTRSGGTTASAMFIDEFRNVGIGTDSPVEKLSVVGGNIRLESTVAGTNGILMIYDSNTTQSGQIYGSSGDLKIYSPGDVLFNQGGNVGIGTSTIPTYWSGYTVLQLGVDNSIFSNTATGTGSALFIGQNLYNDGSNYKYTGASSNEGSLIDMRSGIISFLNAPAGTGTATVTERMRITSGGEFGFGTTSTSVQNGSIYFQEIKDVNTYIKVGHKTGSSSGADFIAFYYDGSQIGGAAQSGTTGVAYNTSSDYRLKENVVEMTGALDRVSQLKPSRFNFITDADKTVDGFLAHEVQNIVPEAITGEKDAMQDEEYEVSPAVYEDVLHPAIEEELDEDGNIITEAKEEWTENVLKTEAVKDTRQVPKYQGIDQSKLVPLLVGAIQELKAEVDDLKNKCNCK
jgi:hypothetical protein